MSHLTGFVVLLLSAVMLASVHVSGEDEQFVQQFGSLMSNYQQKQFNFYKSCHVFNYRDHLCSKCCHFRDQNTSPQPSGLVADHCECVPLHEAVEAANAKGIHLRDFRDKQQVRKEMKSCQKLKFSSPECNRCCNQLWMTAYRSLFGDVCKCNEY